MIKSSSLKFLKCWIRSKQTHFSLYMKYTVLIDLSSTLLLRLTLSFSEFCVPNVICAFMLSLRSMLWWECFLLINFLSLSPLRCCWNILLGCSSWTRAFLSQKLSPASEYSSHILYNYTLLLLLKYDQRYGCSYVEYIPNVFMDVSVWFLVS